MSTWVDEFKALQSPNGSTTGSGSSMSKGKNQGLQSQQQPSKAEQIEAELKLLEWHKLANNAAIKASLLQNKTMRQGNGSSGNKQQQLPPRQQSHEDISNYYADESARGMRMRRIAEEELGRPLELSRDARLSIEREEQLNADKLSQQVDRHITTLKRLRTKLEERAETKSRHDEFRDWKKNFAARKEAILSGQVVAPLSGTSREDQAGWGNKGNISNISSRNNNISAKRGEDRELSTVLLSLNKLSDLEGRILGLEAENRLNDTGGGHSQHAFDYALQGAGTVAGGRRVRAGTFLTDVNSRGPPRNNPMKSDSSGKQQQRTSLERRLQVAAAPRGQQELRARVQAKKSRVRETGLGNARHEAAMRELQRRRHEGVTKKLPAVVGTSRSAPSAGVRGAGNRHLREFAALKQGFQRRKEDMYKRLNTKATTAPSLRPTAGGGRLAASLPPPQREPSAAEVKKIRLGLVPGPVPGRTLPAVGMPPSQRRVVPATKGGTVTRRADAINPLIRRRPTAAATTATDTAGAGTGGPPRLLPAIIAAPMSRRTVHQNQSKGDPSI